MATADAAGLSRVDGGALLPHHLLVAGVSFPM